MSRIHAMASAITSPQSSEGVSDLIPDPAGSRIPAECHLIRPLPLEDLLVRRADLHERIERRARLFDLAGVCLERHLLSGEEIVLVPPLPLNRVRSRHLHVVRLLLAAPVGDVT